MYYAFLGRQTAIAMAELQSVQGNTTKILDEVVRFDGEENTDIESLQNRLGSVIKISEHIFEAKQDDLFDECKQYLEAAHSEGKLTMAVNVYGTKNTQFVRPFLMKLKKALPFSVRFCNHTFQNISSVVTKKQVLAKKGIELNFICKHGTFFVSRTLTCQDIDAYSYRDFKKPARDARNGMLPPKLAQTLINLAGSTENIWDPFCGSGTVLMEGLLMGKNVQGSDLQKEMVEMSDTNVAWLREKFKISEKLESKTFRHNAKDFRRIDVDAIVTEGYLGPPKSKMAEDWELKKTDDALNDIYKDMFKHAAAAGIPTVVICLPVYKMKSKLGWMKKTLASILQSGYNLAALSDTDRQSLLYKRPDQLVYREILKFHLD